MTAALVQGKRLRHVDLTIKGDFCFTMSYPYSTFLTAYNKCYSFTESRKSGSSDGVCTTDCEVDLQELKDTYGCCLTTFNDTYADELSITGNQVLGYDLWTTCGLETTQDCKINGQVLLPPDPTLSHAQDSSRGSTAVTVSVSLTGIYSTALIIINLFIATYI